jgi:predicted esterase
MHLSSRKYLCILILSLIALPTFAQNLEEYKDPLFNYGKIIETRDREAFINVDYQEMRDINGRDEIPVDKVKEEYVDLEPIKQQREITVKYKDGEIETYEVGTPKEAKFAVIFIHGGGGDKTLGVKDWTFGGNFNRLKNLATRNQGLYYSPSVTFDDQGVLGVTAIINQIKSHSPAAKIVIACGSAGAEICWKLADSKEAVPQLSGLVFVGGAKTHPNLEQSVAFDQTLPIVISHGTRDKEISWETMNTQFEFLRKSKKDYPAKFILFQSGNHGTPIRMIDWRATLNWIFSLKDSNPQAEEKPTKSRDKKKKSGRAI